MGKTDECIIFVLCHDDVPHRAGHGLFGLGFKAFETVIPPSAWGRCEVAYIQGFRIGLTRRRSRWPRSNRWWPRIGRLNCGKAPLRSNVLAVRGGCYAT